MKNWYDLTKTEKINLKKEFNSKSNKKTINIILYTLMSILNLISFVLFWIVLILIVAKTNNGCYENYCENNLITFGGMFIICLLLAIICSLFISKNKKEFIKWLKSRNIDK